MSLGLWVGPEHRGGRYRRGVRSQAGPGREAGEIPGQEGRERGVGVSAPRPSSEQQSNNPPQPQTPVASEEVTSVLMSPTRISVKI